MKDEQPIIIRVKRKKHTGHEGGHGSWKIAYADFMTAMMAFFMIMWLISISNPQQLVQIADYFKTPLQVAITGGPRSSTSSSPIPGGGDDPTQKTGEVNKSINADDQKKKLDQIRLNRLRERLDQLIEADPKLRALRPHLVIDMVEEGLRIQIIDSENRPMFKTGSAEIEPYMRDILRSIAPMLNEIPNKISLSGHTDDFQYASGQRRYSNWELSADRANASRRELITGGLADGKMLRVVGMADTMKLKNRPGSDAANRRITLLVLNHDAEVKIEQENAESDAIQINDKDPSSFKQITLPGQPTLNNQKATSVPTTANGSSGGVTPVKTPSTGQPAANNQNVTSASATQSGSSGGVTPALTPSTGQPALNNQNAPSAPTTSTSTSTAPTQNGSSGGGTSVVTPSAGQPALNNQNATSAPTTQNGNSGAVRPVITLSTGQTAPPNPSGNDANKR